MSAGEEFGVGGAVGNGTSGEGMTDAQRHAAGMTVRREVLSDAHVDRAEARKTSFTHDFQDMITRYAWGGIWTRPGLERRERSIVTLSVLAALHHDDELGMHVRAALRNRTVLHARVFDMDGALPQPG